MGNKSGRISTGIEALINDEIDGHIVSYRIKGISGAIDHELEKGMNEL